MKHYYLLLLLGLASGAHGATINWAAFFDNGLASQSPVAELEVGSLVRLGTFKIGGIPMTPAQIQANAQNVAFLNSNFVQVATARIGDNTAGVLGPSPLAAHFSSAASVNTGGTGTNPLNVAGDQMYLWAFSSGDNSSIGSSVSSVEQHGIFYVDKANNPLWAFPTDGQTEASVNIDLTDLTDTNGTSLVTGAAALVGTFGSIPSSTAVTVGSTAPMFVLTVVPEPSSLILLGFGMLGLTQRRRRND